MIFALNPSPKAYMFRAYRCWAEGAARFVGMLVSECISEIVWAHSPEYGSFCPASSSVYYCATKYRLFFYLICSHKNVQK